MVVSREWKWDMEKERENVVLIERVRWIGRERKWIGSYWMLRMIRIVGIRELER